MRLALAEVEATRRFRGPNTIRVFDSCVLQDDADASRILGNVPSHDEEGARTGKVVYIVLPYYRNGNVQDAINAHVVNSTRYNEVQMLRIFEGTCRAVRLMHRYTLPETRGGDSDNAPPTDAAPLLFDADAQTAAPEMHAEAYVMQERSTEAPSAYAHRDIKPRFAVCAG